jgi:hypothetical protein
MVYLDQKKDETKPEYFYFAQLTAEVRRSWIKNPKGVKVEDFLKPYRRMKKQKTEKKPDWKKKMEEAKSFFFGLTGYKEED